MDQKELISTKYKEIYSSLHKGNPLYGRSSESLYPEISLLISFLQPGTVLDYGCGKGSLGALLKNKFPHIEFYNYDPCVPRYSSLTRNHFDMIINTDVLEHIPEGMIGNVLDHIHSLSNNIFFHLHHQKAYQILPNGENAHCTVKPPEWYHKKIQKLFGCCIPLISKDKPCSAVVTFPLSYEQIFDYSTLIITQEYTKSDSISCQLQAIKRQIKKRIIVRIATKIDHLLHFERI